MTTVTTSQGHELRAGDLVTIELEDRRWWRRLWYFVTFRSRPMRTRTFKIGETTSTSFTISI